MNLNRMSSAGDLQSGVRKGLHFWRQIKPAQLLNELLLPAALCCTPQPSRQCLHEPASPQYFLKSTFKCITKALYLPRLHIKQCHAGNLLPRVCLCHIPSLRHHWDVSHCVHTTDSFFPMLRSVQLIGTPCGVIHLKEAICMSGNGCLRKPSRLPSRGCRG